MAAATGAPVQKTPEPVENVNMASMDSVNINVLRQQPAEQLKPVETGQPVPLTASIESVPNQQMLAPQSFE